MKRVYWQPRRASRLALLVVSALAVLALSAVELLKREVRQPNYRQKLAAARLAEEGLRVVRNERLTTTDLRIDPETDPTGSGLIGLLMSEVTSNSGNLSAKQLSLNPNFAAVVVTFLLRAGVQEDDVVAVGFSGSFPALNVAVMAALATLGARPIIISSNAASQWGANDPQFSWVDWERTLFEKHVFEFRSVAVSVGGIDDRGLGMSAEGRSRIEAAIARARVPILAEDSYEASVNERMRLYRELAGTSPIKAYINVGGGTTSVGTRVGKHLFKPGYNARPPVVGAGLDSVMSRFAEEGVPIVHLVSLHELARRYGLALPGREAPKVGEGKVFSRDEYNPWIAGTGLAVLLVALVLMVRGQGSARSAGQPGSQRGTQSGLMEPPV